MGEKFLPSHNDWPSDFFPSLLITLKTTRPFISFPAIRDLFVRMAYVEVEAREFADMESTFEAILLFYQEPFR